MLEKMSSRFGEAGVNIRGVQASASGPVSYMGVFDATCRTILSAGQRPARGQAKPAGPAGYQRNLARQLLFLIH